MSGKSGLFSENGLKYILGPIAVALITVIGAIAVEIVKVNPPCILNCPVTTPVPQARVVGGISDGQSVDMNSNVVIKYENIPKKRYLWVAVHIPSLGQPRLVFPQAPNGVMPVQVSESGTLPVNVILGNKNDVGAPLNVMLLLLNDEANDIFKNNVQTCLQSNNCSGLVLPDAGVDILDFITVIRK